MTLSSRQSEPAARITARYHRSIQPQSIGEHTMTRRFEFVGGNSAKFWEVTIRGAT